MQRGNRLSAPAADLIAAREQERSRIASEIHDDALQTMFAAAVRLQTLAAAAREPSQRELLERLSRELTDAVRRLRRSLFDRGARSLEPRGLGAAIEEYLTEVGPRPGFRWEVHAERGAARGDAAKLVLYRIAQEAMRNVRKHARARNVSVAVRRSREGTLLRVTDDGVGFDPELAGRAADHLGLVSMRARATLAGGTLRVESVPGGGCVVEAWVPDLATPGAS